MANTSSPTHPSRSMWRKEFASTGEEMHSLVDDVIPYMVTLSLTDDEEEKYIFNSPPPPPTSKTTQRQSLTPSPLPSKNKRYKKMEKIRKEVNPEHWELAWTFVGIEARKSPVAEILRTGLNLKLSLAEVLQLEKELDCEFNQVMTSLRNHGSFHRESTTICYTNFLRDMLDVPDIAMIRMRRILAECKCCEKHQSRRPCCQEKKREPDYDILANPEDDHCKCSCRQFMRRLEQALTDEHPLKVKGQLWQRSI